MGFATAQGLAPFLDVKGLKGHLLLVLGVSDVDPNYQSTYKGQTTTQTKVTFSFVDLDGDGKVQTAADTHGAITGALVNLVGTDDEFLGRLDKVAAKKSGNEYWTFLPFVPGKDDTRAQAWLDNNAAAAAAAKQASSKPTAAPAPAPTTPSVPAAGAPLPWQQ